MSSTNDCAYCRDVGGILLWQNVNCRVVLVSPSPFLGWCRVIWNDHRREMTDLTADARSEAMSVTFAVEAALRSLLKPDKINLASLGTGLPHLHWHVIPRFFDDSHYPEPIWASAVRPSRRSNEPADFVGSLSSEIGRAMSKATQQPISDSRPSN